VSRRQLQRPIVAAGASATSDHITRERAPRVVVYRATVHDALRPASVSPGMNQRRGTAAAAGKGKAGPKSGLTFVEDDSATLKPKKAAGGGGCC